MAKALSLQYVPGRAAPTLIWITLSGSYGETRVSLTGRELPGVIVC
jgi:hypothetical protein